MTKRYKFDKNHDFLEWSSLCGQFRIADNEKINVNSYFINNGVRTQNE